MARLDPRDDRIVREELRRLARGMLPLALVTYGVFALLGRYQLSVVLSIALGTGYALFNFYQIGTASLRIATLYREPARAQRSMFTGYLVRYALTGLLVVVAFRVPLLNPAAVIIPLFYTKMILLISNRKSQDQNTKKGG